MDKQCVTERYGKLRPTAWGNRDAQVSIIDAVRRAFPNADATRGLLVARILVKLRHGQTVVRNDALTEAVRSAFLKLDRAGVPTEYATGPAPDPFTARKHETTSKRSNSGRTITEVKRYGLATVQGETDSTYGHGNEHGAILSQVLKRELDSIRRHNCGADAIAVTKLADEVYGPLGLEPLQGTDVRQFAQIIRPAKGVDPSACRVAFSHAQLGTLAPDSPIASLAALPSVYVPDTASWPTRWKLTTPALRKRERADVAPITSSRRATIGHDTAETITTTIKGKTYTARRWNVADDMSTVRTFTVQMLASASDDDPEAPLFIGCRIGKAVRPEPVKVARRGKRKAREVATVESPQTVGAWQALAEHLNRGETIATYDGVRISRALKSGRFNVTDPRGDEPIYWRGVRTTTAVALKLAS